ncbi:putative molybdenum transport system permease protein YvgM [Polycladomyces abyssicola]|jgi:molybdate transport system permease protein|uniref:Molybdenum transport system permease n=1 Tax=Polycladomyces abyssicola TaxID=1125966 RepID=A0A8D5UED0_9BACL|nr:molybdate ABC transporter permease subunit [Polycladomyces abyssicola]BCU80769.1 putative molybdenum transport system permease protein YvgM [Polycladomyces abyssicola]
MMNQDFWSPIWLSLEVNGVASILVFVIALVAAWWMKGHSFYGKSAVETLLILPLVLPPTVVGFGLLVLMGRKSWIGQAMEWLFHQPILFTWWAAVIAAVVVAFPLVYQTLKNGFESVDRELEDAARSMGAGEWQVFRYITLPLSWRSLLTGYVLGFARGMGEFGATLMVAGNIPGKTQTIPTAIYIAVESGDTRLAAYWVASTVLLSFALLAIVQRMKIRS